MLYTTADAPGVCVLCGLRDTSPAIEKACTWKPPRGSRMGIVEFTVSVLPGLARDFALEWTFGGERTIDEWIGEFLEWTRIRRRKGK